LWTVLQWTWNCKCLFDILIPFLLDTYRTAELLDNMVVLFLIFWGGSILFSKMVILMYAPTNSGFQDLLALVFLTLAILTRMSWYLIVVLTCIILVVSDVDGFLCICWPFVCLLEKCLFRCFAHLLIMLVLAVEFSEFLR
jgi:hypothetical protein